MVLHRPVELAGILRMYGPPQSCKRKTKNGSWSAPMYSALNGVSAGLARWGFPDDPVMAAPPTHNAGQLIAGPELEIATDTSAIPNSGRKVAQSPQSFTSRYDFPCAHHGLNSDTSYYYTVESTGATAISDGVSSPVRTFKTKIHSIGF
jgi:hypothetical protein